MSKFRLVAILALMLLAGKVALADHSYMPGRLLDATTEDRLNQGTTTSHAIYTVQVEGIMYTVRGERVGGHTKDYTKGMIVGDAVDARVDGKHLYLRTPKGKEIKTDILKRARSTN